MSTSSENLRTCRTLYQFQLLANVGNESTVGTVGNSYHNAFAETIIGVHNTAVIRARGRSAISMRSNTQRS